MQTKRIDLRNLGVHSIEVPDTCPICHANISPMILFGCSNEALFGEIIKGISVALACPFCHKLFIASYLPLRVFDDCYPLDDVAPKFPSVQTFEPSLEKISPQFIEIYHQAQAAEAYNLDQIAGIGYRKALEFLIKDYAIRLHPEEEATIKQIPLAQCIDRYIDLPKIKSTATAAVWIGNDETHYIRKWENRDIEDMKTFMAACMFWILADYQAHEAAEMITT